MSKKKRTYGIAAAAMSALLGVSALGVTLAHANPGSNNGNGTAISGNTPGWVKSAKNLGATDASKTIDVTVWLKLHNEGQLQKQLHDMYTPGSKSYHQFLSQNAFNASYSPTSQELNSVEHFLSAHGFTIDNAADNNFYVNVSGTVAQAEKAFHVQINNYQYQGQTYFANAADPSVTDTSGGNIANVTGLDDASNFTPDILRAGATAASGNPATAVSWNAVCGGLGATKTITTGTESKSGTFTQTGTTTLTNLVPCGYTATQLQKAYGVDQLLKQGIDGTGQTIAIVDAYGSPTILNDANAYSKAYGLPQLVAGQNFEEVTPQGVLHHHETAHQDPLGWQAEVTLDVETAHAIAPGAKIVLVAAPNNYSNLDEADNWVVIHHLANIISNSWGLSSDLMDPGKGARDERIFMQAAAEGIGVNFSSGDSGDELANTGVKSVDYPASSPWVTAVGGTSLFLNSDNSYNLETGWGNDLPRAYSCGTYTSAPVTEPTGITTNLKTCNGYYSNPGDLGFGGGSGGGLSFDYTAQPWQSNAIGNVSTSFGTVGTHRAVPDVSMLADPYTGANVWITDKSVGDTQPEIEPYGGTSLACPMFSAMMALVDQARANNHEAPAGLASQYLYNLSGNALHDVTPAPQSVGNDNNGTSFSLNYGSRYSGTLFTPTFNQDSSLTTGTGWDDVTGVGSPNGAAFVSAMAAQN